MEPLENDDDSQRISVDRLRPGMHIRLELGWLDHPFPFNSFKIHDGKQVETLRSLGLKEVIFVPEKSDIGSLPPPLQTYSPPTPEPVSAAHLAALAEKKLRIERVRAERESIQRCERKFVGVLGTVKNIIRNLLSNPEESVEAANELIQEMVDSLLTDRNIALHLMNDKISGEDVYHHSLNVSILAMMLGRECHLSSAEINILGVGGLFHDIGKSRIPDKVLLKTEKLNHAERSMLKMHCAIGEEIGMKIGLLPEAVNIIGQHHETMDGKGYPRGLKGAAISRLVRIVAIANRYDNLCNRLNPNDSMTPHEALSHMFRHERHLHDTDLLKLFIHCMGVYPPGSIVQLSNEAVGIVVSVDGKQTLHPSVLIYDPTVPKEEAIIYDLADDPGITITESLKPNLLLREIYDYLSPRKRMTYYFNSRTDGVSGKH